MIKIILLAFGIVILIVLLLPIFICFEILGRIDWNIIGDIYKSWIKD